MDGKVKWFSSNKGFGFIHGNDGIERHFAVRDITGAELPSNGDSVSFEHQDGKKGPRALKVSITSRAAPSHSNSRDDRAICSNCQKRMIPRIITGPPLVHGRGSWTPVPKRSICPFCGHTHQEFPASGGELAGAILFGIVAMVFLLFFFSRW